MNPSALLASLTACACLAGPARAQQNPAAAPQNDADAGEFLATLEFLRDRNARDYAITSPNGIDEAEYVEIGGVPQWIIARVLPLVPARIPRTE